MSAAARKVAPAPTLRERVITLQAELGAALMELALEMREENRRQGPQTEGCTPPLEYFLRQLEKDAYVPCKCQMLLSSERE
jgi:hypothetical protein